MGETKKIIDMNQRGHKSKESALNGVANYIQDKMPNLRKELNHDPNLLFNYINKLMIQFLIKNMHNRKENNSHGAQRFNAISVQNHFPEFKLFIKSKTEKL